MKSIANFYSIEINHDLNLCICNLIKKLFKKDKNIILIDSKSQLERLDKLLWSFEQNSFLPHKIYNDGDLIDVPILLLSIDHLDKLKIFKNFKSIINNYDNALLRLDDNFNIYEFVDNKEEGKALSRRKFLDYKNNNFTLVHNKYDEQAV